MKYWFAPRTKEKNKVDNNYRHCILLDGGNSEKILKPLQKAAEPTDEVTEWLNENIGEDNWQNIHGLLSFKNKESAMAVILKWS